MVGSGTGGTLQSAYLIDPTRLEVALTTHRQGLVIIGSEACWKNILKSESKGDVDFERKMWILNKVITWLAVKGRTTYIEPPSAASAIMRDQPLSLLPKSTTRPARQPRLYYQQVGRRSKARYPGNGSQSSPCDLTAETLGVASTSRLNQLATPSASPPSNPRPNQSQTATPMHSLPKANPTIREDVIRSLPKRYHEISGFCQSLRKGDPASWLEDHLLRDLGEACIDKNVEAFESILTGIHRVIKAEK